MKGKTIKQIRLMMNIIIFITAILTVFIVLPDMARAGDSISFTVTCTVPAIPGVNVPLIEEETTGTDTQTFKPHPERTTDIQENNKEQSPILMQEDKPKQLPLSEGGQTLPMVIKTLYCR